MHGKDLNIQGKNDFNLHRFYAPGVKKCTVHVEALEKVKI